MREAINARVKEDRKRLRELKRVKAMEMIGRAQYDNLFESIEGEDFSRHGWKAVPTHRLVRIIFFVEDIILFSAFFHCGQFCALTTELIGRKNN